MLRLQSLCAAAAIAAFCLVGCLGEGEGGEQQPVYPVTGTVTLAGSPVAGASVTFAPVDKQPAAMGRTDAQGKYTLTTYDAGDGAAVGLYKVIVTKNAPSQQAAATPEASHGSSANYGGAAAHAGPGASAASESGSLLPARYSTMDETPLSMTVEEKDENVLDLKLDP